MDMDIKFNKVTALLVLISFNQWYCSGATCYFPQEFQGEFLMQSTVNVGSGIQYSKLDVTATSIPIWGLCHRRIGNNFILMLNYDETSCIRCLHLKLRSANVLQVFTSRQEVISQCYTNEELAENNCPSEESLANRETTEILLFKTKDALDAHTRKEYCPIDGKYSVKYKGNNLQTPNECTGSDSTMDSCPSGSTMNFRLRGCTSDTFDLKFECLGNWKAPNNEMFLVFIDNHNKDSQKPKYRCALYNQDHRTGEIEMALSIDSTCTTDLVNSTSGYETFTLSPKLESPWPAEASFGMCSFPKWMRGNWEHIRVDDDTMIYKDHTSFKTYTIKCVGVQEGKDKYLVFTRTQCDEEYFNCMKISKRSNNIFEFQLGSNASTTKDVFVLCSEDNFQEDSWITQGRTNTLPGVAPGMCPISGEFTGVIPDADDLCAKLWSDCRAPELMYYQVSHCETMEIYEEREYRCLGHWRESEFLYTYTQRKDVAAGTYECFVGSIISDTEIYIKEAGEHCQRHINPLQYGMQLNKKSLYSCISPAVTPHNETNIRTTTSSDVNTNRSNHRQIPATKPTMKPWNFDSADSDSKKNHTSLGQRLYQPTHTILIIFLWITHLLIRKAID